MTCKNTRVASHVTADIPTWLSKFFVQTLYANISLLCTDIRPVSLGRESATSAHLALTALLQDGRFVQGQVLMGVEQHPLRPSSALLDLHFISIFIFSLTLSASVVAFFCLFAFPLPSLFPNSSENILRRWRHCSFCGKCFSWKSSVLLFFQDHLFSSPSHSLGYFIAQVWDVRLQLLLNVTPTCNPSPNLLCCRFSSLSAFPQLASVTRTNISHTSSPKLGWSE